MVATPGCCRVGSKFRPLVFEIRGSSLVVYWRKALTLTSEDAINDARGAIEADIYKRWSCSMNHSHAEMVVDA